MYRRATQCHSVTTKTGAGLEAVYCCILQLLPVAVLLYVLCGCLVTLAADNSCDCGTGPVLPPAGGSETMTSSNSVATLNGSLLHVSWLRHFKRRAWLRCAVHAVAADQHKVPCHWALCKQMLGRPVYLLSELPLSPLISMLRRNS
jgi:hypothetical protein